MKKQIPKELDLIVDKVLAFTPKPKSKAAKKRLRDKKIIELNDRSKMKRAAD